MNSVNRLLNTVFNKHVLLMIASILLLILVSIYSGRHASNSLSSNSDAVIYPYLFDDFQPNDIILPTGHANILKFPLFFLQSVLPYDIHSFTIVNITLIAATLIGTWAIGIALFDRRYTLEIATILTAIALGSDQMILQIAYTTIRNIEYPLAMAFVIAIATLALRDKKPKTRSRIWPYIFGLLYALFCTAVAGDSLLIMSFILPLIIVLVSFWIKSIITTNNTSKNLNLSIIATVAIIPLSLVVKKLLDSAGLYDLSPHSSVPMSFVSYDNLFESLRIAIGQTIQLSGAWFFGLPPASAALHIVNLLILAVGIYGLYVMIKEFIKTRSEKISPKSLVLAFAGISFFVTFAAYSLSTLVLVETDKGYVSAAAERYITLLPILTTYGFIFMFTKLPQRIIPSSSLILISIVFSCVIFTNQEIRGRYRALTTTGSVMQSQFIKVADILEEKQVDTIVSGYWSAPPIKLHSSQSKLSFYSVAQCNHPVPGYNTKRSFYYRDQVESPKTALIIDRKGFDGPYWQGCSENDIYSIYGDPIEKISVPITAPVKDNFEIIIFDNDLRHTLEPIK